MKYVSKSLEETQEIAREFVRSLKTSDKATVVAMTGDLGSGKTAFSQFVGDCLGVRDHMQSPTFLIEKIYELTNKPWKHLVHIDAYRLEHEQELLTLGWQEVANNPDNLVLVEWAEKVRSILPEDAIHIVFNHEDLNTRQIEIENTGQKASNTP